MLKFKAPLYPFDKEAMLGLCDFPKFSVVALLGPIAMRGQTVGAQLVRIFLKYLYSSDGDFALYETRPAFRSATGNRLLINEVNRSIAQCDEIRPLGKLFAVVIDATARAVPYETDRIALALRPFVREGCVATPLAASPSVGFVEIRGAQIPDFPR